jgi:2-polyprenyl-3-methyl-5-hydroxy-6-metoxy-1,4-benzoquinol methylase
LTDAFHLGFEFRYCCNLSAVSSTVRDAFRQMSFDDEARCFVERRFETPHGWLLTATHGWLRHFASDFDINGWLGTYPLHLLSPPQWTALLGRSFATHLDFGAGNGDLTTSVANLTEHTLTTERARAMRAVLRRRGFECLASDAPASLRSELGSRRFDLVTCLNVLDRTSHPLSLLRALSSLLQPSGYLVLAVPLPLEPFYYAGARTRTPAEPLGLSGDDWEGQCSSLAGRVTADENLELVAACRAPYVSGGDARRRLYVLDDAVLVFRRTGGTAKQVAALSAAIQR